jgi:hypothetical protein
MFPHDLFASLVLVTAAAGAANAGADLGTLPDLTPRGMTSSERLAARGVQVYQCRATPGAASGPMQWVFVAPQADLFDADGRRVGTHFDGPRWQADDGSRIVGSVKARVDAPRAGAIPWLLLTAASEGRDGRFSRVAQVQRINTTGGAAPETGCGAGSVVASVSVPYTADYVFFTP